MRCHEDGDQPATTQVKVLSPEIARMLHWAKISIYLKPESVYSLMVRIYQTCRGLSPWRVGELITLELGRTGLFQRSPQGAEEVIRGYVNPVVGLTHSRGVYGVMPVESRNWGTRRGQRFCAEQEVW
jgi:hypothetical protein